MCRTQIAVSEHFLDMADIRTVIQHVCGHRVAEQVTATGFCYPGFYLVFPDSFADITIPGFVALFV